MPVAECQFGLDQSLIGELEIFARSAVLSVESVMHCRAQIRRPRPSPRQGRRLGPPQVWSLFLLACHYLAFRQALRPLPSVVKGVQACFEQALRPLPSVVKGVQACRLPPKTLRGSFEQALPPLPSVAKGVQACRLPGLKCLKRCAAASSRHSGHCPLLLRAFKPAVCQASNASNARGSFEQALRPLPSVVKGVQACRLPGLKCLKRSVAASSRYSGHCPMLLRTFKPAVCQASNASNAARQLRAGTQATALCC